MLNYLLLYAAYLLGAAIFVLDEIKKYQHLASANPDPSIEYKKMDFWDKEKFNLIQMVLHGVIAVIILPSLFGGSNFALRKESGDVIWAIPMKQALVPMMIVIGWTGGRMVIAFMGKSKKELYKKAGLDDGN